jgi:hypothetical protein
MKVAPAIVLVVVVLLLTINFWYMFYRSYSKAREGFVDSSNSGSSGSQLATIANQVLGSADTLAPETPPTDTEAAQLYYKLLLYIKTDYGKGLKFVYNLNTRIYGSATKIPDNFDPRTLLDNYVNPLTGI